MLFVLLEFGCCNRAIRRSARGSLLLRAPAHDSSQGATSLAAAAEPRHGAVRTNAQHKRLVAPLLEGPDALDHGRGHALSCARSFFMGFDPRVTWSRRAAAGRMHPA